MKTITARVVTKPQVKDNIPADSTTPSFDRKTGVALVRQMNALIDKHNSLVDAMNKVVNMDEDEFSPEKAIGLMTSLIQTSMQLQIFIDKVNNMDEESLEPAIGHACNVLNNLALMIEDLQELFDEATGLERNDIEYCDDEDEDDEYDEYDEDDFPSEEAYCEAIVKSMSNVIAHIVQEIHEFRAEDEFDFIEAEDLRTKAYLYLHYLDDTIKSAKKDDHEDIVKAAVKCKATLKESVKKLKQLIAEHDED